MSAFRIASEWARGARIRTKAVSSTGSTNDDAKSVNHSLAPLMALHGPGDAVLFLADQQTHGRGRNQNQWLANPGQALLASWVFGVDKQKPVQPVLSPLAGLALHDAVHAAWPELTLAIKPPNDLHVLSSLSNLNRPGISETAMKIAGLLIEVISDESQSFQTVIIGLGLNLSGAPEGSTMPYPPTSISAAFAALELPFLESHLFLFLNAFRHGLAAAVTQATLGQISSDARGKLQNLIARHPAFSDVTGVSPQGDLIRTKGITQWSEL